MLIEKLTLYYPFSVDVNGCQKGSSHLDHEGPRKMLLEEMLRTELIYLADTSMVSEVKPHIRTFSTCREWEVPQSLTSASGWVDEIILRQG